METKNPALPEGVAIAIEERDAGGELALASPLKHGTQFLEALTFHPLSGAHVRRTPEADAWRTNGAILEFAGELTATPPSVLDQLRGADIGRVIRKTIACSWPMLDLPTQWEASWAAQAAHAEASGGAFVRPALPELAAPYELALERPIKAGERDTVSLLRFGELTGRVARQLPTDGLPLRLHPWLVQELTGQPREVIDQLTGRDLNRALAVAQLFFLAIRQTTATPGRSSPGA